jgi:excisionase family DNA binding protein
MVQEYLNLDEAAQQLGMTKEDLAKKAQKREIRAFADRGTWKFRKQDIEEHARQAGIGSGAEIVFGDLDEGLPELESGSSDQILLSDQTLAESPSGSSGKRVLGMDEFGRTPSDSDVRLVAESTTKKKGSDSDVKLVGGTKPPSDSDVKVVAAGPEQPESDVKIKGPAPGDSEVRLDRAKAPSDSGIRMADPLTHSGTGDVTQDLPVFRGVEDEGLIISSGSSGDQPIAGDLDSDFDLSPPKDDSSFELGTQGDSDITLALDDSTGLAPEDSKVKLPGESDVTVGSPSSSGLSLSSPADSGIALDRAPTPGRSGRNLGATEGPTKPSSDIFETDFEVPVLDSDQEIPSSGSGSSSTEQLSADSDFELSGSDVGAGLDADSSSQVLSLEGEEQVDESAATRLQAAPKEDEQWEEDLQEPGGEFEEDSGSAPQRAVADDSGSAPALMPVGAAEAEWGGLMIGILGFSAVLMFVLGLVMMDLVRTMWGWEDQFLFYKSPVLNWMSSLFPKG